MYLYMLPLSTGSEGEGSPTAATTFAVPVPDQQPRATLIPTPAHDGGLEHTAAAFDDASAWLARARAGAIILFPPQFYLLHLVSEFLRPLPSSSTSTPTAAPGPAAENRHHHHHHLPLLLQSQRDALLAFLNATPTAPPSPSPSPSPSRTDDPLGTRQIPWSRKVISPAVLAAPRRRRGGDGGDGRGEDGRAVLALDRPGPELRGSGRGGDWERVVLVAFRDGTPRDVEVRWRRDVVLGLGGSGGSGGGGGGGAGEGEERGGAKAKL